MYDTAQYAGSRLQGTYIRDENNVVRLFCDAYGEGKNITLVLQDIKTGVQTHHLMRKCNLKPIPLGYVQVGEVSTFVARQPLRQCWRQGARDRNTKINNRRVPFASIIQNVQHCVDNIYPTLSNALLGLTKGWRSVAISRKFSIDDRFNVHYKGTPVGKFLIEEGCIQLKQHYIYLNEQLDGALR